MRQIQWTQSELREHLLGSIRNTLKENISPLNINSCDGSGNCVAKRVSLESRRYSVDISS